MEPREDFQTEHKHEPPTTTEDVKPRRFRIEPLEERIAPGISRTGTD
jgi:hypothetical protein